MCVDQETSASTSTFPSKQYQLIHEIYVLSDVCDRIVLDEFNLNISQYRLLLLLHNEHGQRLTTLSEHLLLSKSTITRIVDQLEAIGWVKRVAEPGDRRAQRVVLTPAGFEQRTIISASHIHSLHQRMRSMDEDQQKQLVSLLDKLREGLRSRIAAENSSGAAP
jgi:DNA-binding MarR family transcriptional regulator